MRRITAAISLGLILLVGIAVAEAALLTLLFLFASILKLDVAVEIGGNVMRFGPLNVVTPIQVTVANAGTASSFLVTLAFGMGAAVYRYRRWRPVR